MENSPAAASFVDLLAPPCPLERACLDHGFVRLVDMMPRVVPTGETADSAVVQAARVSYGQGTKKSSEDRALIRYLLRHDHGTPIEMIQWKFHVKLPIFVARQWIRHRISSYNEMSARYSEMPEQFYLPPAERVKVQSSTNKQGSGVSLTLVEAEAFLTDLQATYQSTYDNYKDDLKAGISRELSRIGLPIGIYTEWYWSINMRSLLNFLSLRCDKHAQEEIRIYADAIVDLIRPLCPHLMEAWDDFDPRRGGCLFSRQELEIIRGLLPATPVRDNQLSSREWVEFENKLWPKP